MGHQCLPPQIVVEKEIIPRLPGAQLSARHLGNCPGAYLVAGFTEGPPILLVEALPGQLAAADTAREALGMVLPLHGLHSQLSRGHGLVAEGTDVWGRGDTGHDPPSLEELYPVATQNWPGVPGLCLKAPGVVNAASAHGHGHEGH